ncbi:MAG: hypothetical protein AAF391_12395 [Bacteroidota bacterium]
MKRRSIVVCYFLLVFNQLLLAQNLSFFEDTIGRLEEDKENRISEFLKLEIIIEGYETYENYQWFFTDDFTLKYLDFSWGNEGTEGEEAYFFDVNGELTAYTNYTMNDDRDVVEMGVVNEGIITFESFLDKDSKGSIKVIGSEKFLSVKKTVNGWYQEHKSLAKDEAISISKEEFEEFEMTGNEENIDGIDYEEITITVYMEDDRLLTFFLGKN